MSQAGGESRPEREDDRVIRAAEFALGLAPMSDTHRDSRSDPDLAREIERWHEDFAKLADELETISPRPEAWAALHRKMHAGSARAPTTRSWRWLVGAGLAAACVLALMVIPRKAETPPASSRMLLVAAILPKEGPPLFTVTYDPARRTFIVVPAATQPDPHRVAELWLAASDADEPVALVSLSNDRPTVVKISTELAARIKPNAGLVVTSEPIGAALTERGPVLAHGRLESF